MDNQQKGLEIKVGLFVFLGLLVIAVLAIQFGRVGQGLSKYYMLTVKFSNAGGIIKNADVLMSGAKVGIVENDPLAIAGQIGYVPVQLKIREDIKIPVGSYFQINSSGMLGDKSVEIVPSSGFKYDNSDPQDTRPLFDQGNAKMAIAPGASLGGTQVPGLSELTSKGDKNMEKLSATLDELKATLEKIQAGVLSDENMGNIRSSFASIKTTSENMAKASTKIDSVLVEAQGAVNSAKETFTEAKQTITTINTAAGDIRTVIGDVRDVVQAGKGVLKSAQSGPGTLPMLLGNREVSDDLRAVIANIRRHGLIFYRDSAPRPVAAQSKPKAP